MRLHALHDRSFAGLRFFLQMNAETVDKVYLRKKRLFYGIQEVCLQWGLAGGISPADGGLAILRLGRSLRERVAGCRTQ
jgi:hypothetical protein